MTGKKQAFGIILNTPLNIIAKIVESDDSYFDVYRVNIFHKPREYCN